MAFPDTIETGIGLAGPTADIGHADAHAANGVPRLLELLQSSIGTDTEQQTWTPTWNTTPAPNSQVGYWAKMGNLLWVQVSASWSGTATVAPSTLSITGGFPSWGTVIGLPTAAWLGTQQAGTAWFVSGQIQFFKGGQTSLITALGTNESVYMTMTAWTT